MNDDTPVTYQRIEGTIDVRIEVDHALKRVTVTAPGLSLPLAESVLRAQGIVLPSDFTLRVVAQ